MRESKIEAYLVAEVTKLGGEVRKLKWIGRSHAPDRLVAYNGVWLVELKAPGRVERPGQARERERLTANGVRCWVIDSLEGVDNFIDVLRNSQWPFRSLI